MQVCEAHFKDEDIIRTESIYNPKTGERFTSKLSHPKLRPGAIPSILPDCPKYLSSGTSTKTRDGRALNSGLLLLALAQLP
ncbi:unnamed protein product, partial [Allacma fusca]